MFNKPVKRVSGTTKSNPTSRLIVFLSLVTLTMFWLFPKTSMFISLILIALMILLISGRLLAKKIVVERLDAAEEQYPPDPEV